MYKYEAVVYNVVDGDTLDLIIDLGFNVRFKERVRLLGVDTPETRTLDLEEKKRGLEAKEFVYQAVIGRMIRVSTSKEGKYGRYLAVIYYIPDGKKRLRNLNRELVKKGYASEYFGGKRKG